ncbi:metallophosphoesterase [Pedobacter cryotolerans]|uniref:Metallophosphoesterase n=1 Tax=Pedobacter cryotolerans TaxID=2571270 RepID=A0A4U1C866_9SPHI|nr:metallophosphoesterase [Pedobacter cryotolerans]TKC01879.1 metallophosphoesterase [Pedobacter cryotolerans]
MSQFITLSIITLILLAFDFYCYKAILSVFKNWKPNTKKWFKIAYWGYTILLIIGVFCSVYFKTVLFLSLKSIILVAFFLTLVCKFMLLPFLLVDDLRRVFIKLSRLKNKKTTEPVKEVVAGEPISRSEFLIKAGLVAAAVPLTSLSWGIISGAYDYQVRKVKLVLPNLPKAFDGITMAQITDVHSGSFYNKTAVKGGVEMLMAEKPDFVFFTGDLVNNLTNEMREYQDIFSQVKAPLGVYSTLGNHDYGDYHFGRESTPAKVKNLQDMVTTHKNMGWNLLMNENKRLKVDGEEIGVLGIENWGMGRFPKYGKMELAHQNTEDLPVKLLLSHDPSHWRGEVLEKYKDIDAMFSGHTHGMQFGVKLKEFKWSPVQYLYKEWAGLYQEQNQQLYVNVGYGFLGYPGRVGMLPEITIFTLSKA